MSKIKSFEELIAISDSYKKNLEIKEKSDSGNTIKIGVGMATCGIAAGAKEAFVAIQEEIVKLGLKNIRLTQTGCIGSCFAEPVVEVTLAGKEPILYGNVNAEKAKEIVHKHIKEGNGIQNLIISRPYNQHLLDVKKEENKDGGFYKKQIRVALRNCGLIDPENIEEYISVNGYQALGKVITAMKPLELIDLIKKSGLRGRGGGGFPTGIKWESAAKYSADQKYVVCNADEGDPGAFMDRSILEGDPHSVLEAMAIAGCAIGASIGYIYIRAEYPLAIERLKIAIKKASEYGLLGKNIMNSGFDFEIDIRYGAGAFVCGEETALIHSIEGERGEPTYKPPFPAEKGLWGKPTIVNNVETFANIPPIILNGAEWFSKIGTEKSKGTKVFSLAGKVNNVGLVEVPMGTTLREIIYNIGGGIKNNREFKAVQTGGPSGGCITASQLDTAIDYDSLIEIGSMMGSGGMIVMDEDDCMVNIAKFYLEFTMEESCGKCTACRIGNKRLHEMLTKITNGNAKMSDLDELKDLAEIIKDTALCGLGQTSPNPVLSTMKHFRDEYVAHIKDKKCPAGVCKSLLKFIINEKCVGCTACSKICPVKCISGEVKKPHVIDQEKCIKCGACFNTCKFKAIDKK